MSNVSGTIVVYAPSPLATASKERDELSGPGLRFTLLVSREARVPRNGKQDETRIYSAICRPGWQPG